VLPLLLGEAPSKSGDRYWQFPLSGAVGERLCRVAGIEPQESGTRYGRWYWSLVEHFECRNLMERYPGPLGKGAAFPAGQALAALQELLPEIRGRVVVVLGARLGSMFGIYPGPGFYEWHKVMHLSGERVDLMVASIPHPSGLNHLYNDPATYERGRAVLQEAMRRAAEQTFQNVEESG